ncbi:hypothetical protein ACL02T_19965 [Pseudonocardia sp. RS010]|uniref:hypothetical protein n=1 Tax=Pseudonocardia sp. RS010 TaxID=3385979 RepID=UPI0039A33006
MDITPGALKHGIPADAIRAVVAAPLWRADQDPGRTLCIGPDRDRNLLEVVVEHGPAGERVVHAMRLRPKHYGHLRQAHRYRAG